MGGGDFLIRVIKCAKVFLVCVEHVFWQLVSCEVAGLRALRLDGYGGNLTCSLDRGLNGEIHGEPEVHEGPDKSITSPGRVDNFHLIRGCRSYRTMRNLLV